MRKFAACIFALAFCISIAAAAEKPGLTAFLGRIATEQPSVKWDAKSVVKGDFDGSHRATFAVIGYKDKHVMVAVGRNAADGSVTAQYLEFGIDPAQQNAICGLPAHLKLYPLVCSGGDDGQELPGCQETPGASALSLDDDRCDPINMYWNHGKKLMMWWRN